MEKFIACCGLDCATCDARIATLKNDQTLREKTAELWRKNYNAPHISAEMINCTGCIEPGVKFGHCEKCEIRNCAKTNGFKTCAECKKIESCSILNGVLQYVPDALNNLKSLN